VSQVALVAGASSGLGRHVAARLAKAGFTVYAGARSFARGAPPPDGCVPVPLDVTDDASVREAIRHVLSAGGRIDALVCSAAVLTLGAVEELAPEELSRVLEVNVGGMLRMVQAVLPTMRARGKGRIVLFSSLNGRMAVPFQGAYTASKHAVEGLAQALRMETRRYGVSITVVEPGDCRGGSDAYRGHAARAEATDSPYRETYLAATARIARDEAQGLSPERVANAVLSVLTRRRPPARRVVAQPLQRAALALYGILPARWFFRALEWYYGIPVRSPLPKE